jgi:hypothetical protein
MDHRARFPPRLRFLEQLAERPPVLVPRRHHPDFRLGGSALAVDNGRGDEDEEELKRFHD